MTLLYLIAQSILSLLLVRLRELAFPIIRMAAVCGIETNIPTLLERHICGGFDPNPSNQEVCTYKPANDVGLIMLGYSIKCAFAAVFR